MMWTNITISICLNYSLYQHTLQITYEMEKAKQDDISLPTCIYQIKDLSDLTHVQKELFYFQKENLANKISTNRFQITQG